MSATNSTPNYELPIFEATDKPTWQGDFNEAMNKIDNAISERENEIGQNTSNITTLQQRTQNLSNELNSSNARITTLENKIENNYITITENNLVNPSSVVFPYSDASRNIYYNGNTIQFMCAYTIISLAGATQVGSDYLVPLIKIPRNIFGLQTSNITDNSNKYRLTNTWLQNTEANIMHLASVSAYFDGTNTILYVSVGENWGNVFWFTVNVTTLNAGLSS